MKKRVLVTGVIAGLISGAAFAQTNVVSSANVVGYNQITMSANEYVLIALDFENPSNTVNGLFGSLPVSSEVTFWNPTTQQYNTLTKLRTGWSPSGTNVLSIGAGAFLKIPAATNVYLAGDVPLTGTTTVFTVNGYKMMSYPYPADMPFTNTALAKTAAVSDEVSIWGTNGWSSYTKIRTGWSPSSATNLVLKVGQALIYKAATTRAVNEGKPYTIE
jgi:hypothetical protein